MASYQNGGWYPVGPGGKARQYWNGQWFDTPQQNGGNSGGNQVNSIEQQNNDAVNKYIEDLMNTAKGQRDLMLKKLDADHKLALGSDDGAKAQFLESVADSLEQKIGRIPYDYQKYSARELEDYAKNNGRIVSAKETALQRINEDEKTLLRQSGQEEKVAGQNQQESLNSRGLLTTDTPGEMNGIAGEQFNQNVTTPFAEKNMGIRTSAERGRFDTTTAADQSLQDLGVNHARTLADLKTDARRGGIDSENSFTLGTQGANDTYEQQRKALERQRDTLLRQSKIQSSQITGTSKGILGY